MNRVQATPPLPYPDGKSLDALAQFDKDMRKALYQYLMSVATRLNGVMPKDGTEPFTNYVQIQRDVVPEQFFRLGPSDSVGHNIKGFSLPANGKSFVFNATTDDADTAPSGGENSYSFQIRSVEKLRIDDSANAVEVKSGVLLDVQSGQIKFPATQAASSNANTLDDYEEGTWTPALTFSTPGDFSVGYTAQQARYVKFGKLVWVSFHVVTSSFTFTTSGGELRITGLPFTPISTVEFTGPMEAGSLGFGAGRTQVNTNIYSGNTFVRPVTSGSGVARTNLGIADAPSGTNRTYIGSVIYEATA